MQKSLHSWTLSKVKESVDNTLNTGRYCGAWSALRQCSRSGWSGFCGQPSDLSVNLKICKNLCLKSQNRRQKHRGRSGWSPALKTHLLYTVQACSCVLIISSIVRTSVVFVVCVA